jgi:hypothetical protein
MAVTETRLHSAGTTGDAEGVSSASVSGGYTVQYRAKVSNSPAVDTAAVVLRHFKATNSLPWIGRAFKVGAVEDRMVSCQKVRAEYIENSDGWYIVNCEFKSLEVSAPSFIPDDQEDEDPVLWHDDIDVSFTQMSVPVDKAIFRGFENALGANSSMKAGEELPVTNSARIPFDPQIEEEEHIKVIRITKNVPKYDDSFFDKYQGAINEDEVTINKPEYGFSSTFGKHQGLIRVQAQFAIENKVRFWKQTVEIHVRKRGWRRSLLDQGFQEIYKAGDRDTNNTTISASNLPARDQFEYRTITGSDGHPILIPVLLNGQGKKLRDGYKAVYGIWSTKDEIAFAGINW